MNGWNLIQKLFAPGDPKDNELSNPVNLAAPLRTRRHIAYREFGDPEGANILLCIPCILESQNSFDELVTYVQNHTGCRLITVDHCGRGRSDWLDDDHSYKMSIYLEDLRTLITHLHATHKRLIRRLYLLGSGMGALLAMNLAAQHALRVKGLILNDLGLTLSWSGLFLLYGNTGDSIAHERALESFIKMRFDPRLIHAISHPSHVDIDYHFNFRGIHFDNVIHDFEGSVLLIRGEHSETCEKLDELVVTQFVKNVDVLEIAGETHPVRYRPEVLSRLSEILDLKKKTIGVCAEAFSSNFRKLDVYALLACK